MESSEAKASGAGQGARAFDALTALGLLIAVLAAAGAGLFWPSNGGGSIEAPSVRGETVELYGRGLYRFDTRFAGAWGRNTAAQTVYRQPQVARPVSARLQATLDSLGIEAGLPGATAVLVLPDNSLHVAAAGWADREESLRMTPETWILSGSTGKSFVAAVALSLAQEGRLDLDAPVSTPPLVRPPAERGRSHAAEAPPPRERAHRPHSQRTLPGVSRGAYRSAGAGLLVRAGGGHRLCARH